MGLLKRLLERPRSRSLGGELPGAAAGQTVHAEAVSSRSTARAEVVPIVYSSFAPAWYADAKREATVSGRDARRREITFSVCFAESYIYEWVRDEFFKNRVMKIFELFPDDDRRSVEEKWREVPKSLHQAGLIPGKPDFGGPHGEDWKKLIRHRNELVHAGVSVPGDGRQVEGLAGLASAATELEKMPVGWALSVVRTRIERIHAAADRPLPHWLTD